VPGDHQSDRGEDHGDHDVRAPAANGFCRAANDSGTSATVRSTVRPVSVHAAAGRSSHESQLTGHLRSR
jgi:hypothetical protein